MSGKRKPEQEKVVIVNGKKIVGWQSRDGIAAVDGTSLPWGPFGAVDIFRKAV